MFDNIITVYGETPNLLVFNRNFEIGRFNHANYISKFRNDQPIFYFNYNATSEKFELINDNPHSMFCVFYFNIFLNWADKSNEDKAFYIPEYIREIKERELKLFFETESTNVSDTDRKEILEISNKFLFLFESVPNQSFLNNYQNTLVCDAVKNLLDEVKTLRKEFEVYS